MRLGLAEADGKSFACFSFCKVFFMTLLSAKDDF